MGLRKEVLRRILLAKSILSPVLIAGWERPNAHAVAKQVLNAHDAADLVFAAIADHQNKLPTTNKAPSMLDCLGLIRTEADKHSGYFKQLNEARNSLKHAGNLPNATQWAAVGRDVFEKLSTLCQATLNVSLEELDESELLENHEAKAYLSSAKQARSSGDHRIALEELGKALFVSLEAAPDMTQITVGRPRAEDALKLLAFGVPANDFLKLQEFLPIVLRRGEEPDIHWKQSKFGHPGNWREETVDFCLSTYVNVALSIQNATWTPHAVRFDLLYEYKITASKENVEVWEDLVENHLTEDETGARIFRAHKRYMHKGESIKVPSSTPHFVSEDFPLLIGGLFEQTEIEPHARVLGVLGGVLG